MNKKKGFSGNPKTHSNSARGADTVRQLSYPAPITMPSNSVKPALLQGIINPTERSKNPEITLTSSFLAMTGTKDYIDHMAQQVANNPSVHPLLAELAEENTFYTVYYHPNCPACEQQIPKIKKLAKQYNITVKYIDISKEGAPPDVKKVPTVKVNTKSASREVALTSIPVLYYFVYKVREYKKNGNAGFTAAGISTSQGQEDLNKTACLNCSVAHLATVSGSLNEAIRFAREGGIKHPEATRRLAIALEEIAIMERIDLAPDAIQKLPPEQQKAVRELQPLIRKLRQHITEVKSYEDLEKVAAEARELHKKSLELNIEL